MLPGQKLQPGILLRQILADYPNAKAVVVSVMDEKDDIYAYWSSMDTSELALHLMTLQHYAMGEITR